MKMPIVRVCASLACVLLSIPAALNAIGNSAVDTNPQLAVAVGWNGARARAVLADRLLVNVGTNPDYAAARDLAGRSVVGESLNPVAVRLLGINAELAQQPVEASQLGRLADRISRRDLPSQFWLIETSAHRGDLTEALYHYDVAMRTAPGSWSKLFPILTAGLEDAEIRQGLAARLKARPQWMFAFINHALTYGNQPRAMLDVLIRAGGLPRTDQAQAVYTRLLGEFVRRNDEVGLQRAFAFVSGRNLYLNNNPGFSEATFDPRYRPFSWFPAELETTGVTLDSNNAVRVVVGSGFEGLVLSRVYVFRAGRYRFDVREHQTNRQNDAWRFWRIRCVKASATPPIWDGTSTRGRAASFSTELIVATDCPFQVVELFSNGGHGADPSEFTIDRLMIASDEGSPARPPLNYDGPPQVH